ncbi:peptidoglycan N-acetylglucosamine deacetylase, partial [Bacillus thuringiensis]
MKELQNKKKTSVVTKAILSLGVVLATTLFTFFLIGKWNAIPAKGVANESSNPVNTQQQEKKKETPPAKQKKPDGKPVGKVVYLTFDDGPSELTGKFLDVLK